MRPPRGTIRFGSLRRLTPVSRVFGLDRGQAIDRYYIEKFLSMHAADIHGQALEFGDDRYARKFGWSGNDQGHGPTSSSISALDILHVYESAPDATIAADLVDAPQIASESFDCIICTQTLQMIFDVAAAIRTLYRIVKPNGVLLATFPGISQISRHDMDRWGDRWRFTSLSAKTLFGDVFGAENVAVHSYGNVLTAIAFLQGLAAQELRVGELDYNDPDYELVLAVRAVKKSA